MKHSSLMITLASCLQLISCTVILPEDINSATYDSTTSWQQHHKKNRTLIAHLEVGEQFTIVINNMGTPQYSENFIKGNNNYTVLFYATSHSGKMDKDSCTPLIFKNKQLTGWGEQAYRTTY